MNRTYLSWPLFIKWVMVYLLLCLVFYQTARHQFDYRTCNFITEKTDETIGEIVDGKSFCQQFTYNGDHIHTIQVMAGTYMRENNGMLHVALLDGRNHVLWQTSEDLDKIKDNAILEFFPDYYCNTSQQNDGKYCLKVWSEGCSAGNAVTLYCGNYTYNAAGSLGTSYIPGTDGIRSDRLSLYINVIGDRKNVWFGYYWHMVCVVGVVLASFYLRQSVKERQGKTCVLHYICSTPDTYRFLIKQLVVRDFKTKYKRSILGALWSFLNPLCTMAVQYIVFSTIFRSDIRNYPVYLLSASVLFNFFTESTGGGLLSIVGNASLITKVYVPKYIYPVTKVLSTAVNLLISMLPLLVVVLITGEQITRAYLLIPYVLVCLLLFSIGMSLFLSALMVFFRDMQFLWGIVSLLWMYATPMFYPQEIIPERFRFVLDYNPMYYYISFFRTILLEHVSPQIGEYLSCMAFSILFCTTGAWFFRHCQKKIVLYL